MPEMQNATFEMQTWQRARRLFAFCILNLALLCAPIHAQSVDESLDAGFAALQKGDADRAATAFRRALGVQPEHPAALYGAGAAAHLQGRDTDAIAFLKRAAAPAP